MTKFNYPPANAFHWRDDIFFKVEPNGNVRCWQFGKRLFFEMPLSDWDSIAAFVEHARATLERTASTEGRRG